MKTYWLKFQLLSDATFGRGDGLAGVVDVEVQHDSCGLPYMGGKTLKGMLMAECAEILNAIGKAVPERAAQFEESARRLFGDPGSRFEQGRLHVGDAQLPADLRAAIEKEFYNLAEQHKGDKKARSRAQNILRHRNLNSLTLIRRQTAMDASGAPQAETLRSIRMIVRHTLFEASLEFMAEPEPLDVAFLAACVKAFRRAGTGRHRGRGQLKADLYALGTNEILTNTLLSDFEKAVQK